LDNWPEAILRFVEGKRSSADFALPQHYPKVNHLTAFQSGFRVHGITGKDLTSREAGAWQPSWFVIATNGFGDPFFFDLNEGEAGFPIYWAMHGAGRWDPEPLAASVTAFEAILLDLNAIGDDDERAIAYLEGRVNLASPFWREVHDARRERSATLEDDAVSEVPDPDGLVPGALILAKIGPQKIKVVSALGRIMGLSPGEALSLSRRPNLTVRRDLKMRLMPIMGELVALGAEVRFEAD
jgi:hypothetical protein